MTSLIKSFKKLALGEKKDEKVSKEEKDVKEKKEDENKITFSNSFKKIIEKQCRIRQLFYDILDKKISKTELTHSVIGAYEWCTDTYNIIDSHTACPNRCFYCYARKGALKMKREQKLVETIKTDEKKVTKDWSSIYYKESKIHKGTELKREEKVLMFPSTHDLFFENIDSYITVAKKMMDAGHSVLCVSKPRLGCMKKICDELKDYSSAKSQTGMIMFRFTIGSSDQKVLDYWEPYTPEYKERVECLKYVFSKGFVTSVSMEPLLSDPEQVIKDTLPYISDTIWIGYMNHMKQPDTLSHTDIWDEKKVADIEELAVYGEKCENYALKEIPKIIYDLVLKYKNNPKFQWKESVMKDLIKRYGIIVKE
jgi:DNA repair photolyase